MGQRHEDGSHTGSSHFGDGQGSRPADHQVGPGIGSRHILDKFAYLGIDTLLGIGRADGVAIALATLVTHLDRHTSCSDRCGHLLVEHASPQTSTHNQQMQRLGFATQLRIRQCDHFGANRVTHYGSAATRRKRPRECHQHPLSDTRQQLVGHTGSCILFVQQQRDAGEPGSHATRAGRKAPHAKHYIRANGFEHLTRLQHGFHNAIGRRQQPLDAVATHPLNIDKGDGVAMGRHQLGFHPVGGAQPVDSPALLLQSIGYGQTREDMSPGTTCHHQQRLAH